VSRKQILNLNRTANAPAAARAPNMAPRLRPGSPVPPVLILALDAVMPPICPPMLCPILPQRAMTVAAALSHIAAHAMGLATVALDALTAVLVTTQLRAITLAEATAPPTPTLILTAPQVPWTDQVTPQALQVDLEALPLTPTVLPAVLLAVQWTLAAPRVTPVALTVLRVDRAVQPLVRHPGIAPLTTRVSPAATLDPRRTGPVETQAVIPGIPAAVRMTVQANPGTAQALQVALTASHTGPLVQAQETLTAPVVQAAAPAALIIVLLTLAQAIPSVDRTIMAPVALTAAQAKPMIPAATLGAAPGTRTEDPVTARAACPIVAHTTTPTPTPAPATHTADPVAARMVDFVILMLAAASAPRMKVRIPV